MEGDAAGDPDVSRETAARDEPEALRWLDEHLNVSRETVEKLQGFVRLVREENRRQNLISRSTIDRIWSRHILDSAQLIRFAPSSNSSWIDLGSGAGFPGMVVALLHSGPVTLVEERRLRVDFLERAAELLALEVEIMGSRVERLDPRPFDVISARAFAPLDRLFGLGSRFSTASSVWILPKGRNAKTELEAVESSWQGAFELEPSLTDSEASIILATKVVRRPKRNRR